MGAAEDALRDRELGRARTGTVWLRDFDKGVMDTLAHPNGVINDDPSAGPVGVFVSNINGVCPPDGYPGVQVIFAYPEDVALSSYKTPYILVQRNDFSSAMDRWHPGTLQYKAPADGALPATYTVGTQTKTGFDRLESLPQAEPYDIVYTISAKGKFRGAGQRNNVDNLFRYLLRKFPAYGKVTITDSIGDLRSYEAFNEGVSNLDGVGEIQERVVGMAITLRVEAELDLKDPSISSTVRQINRTLLPF